MRSKGQRYLDQKSINEIGQILNVDGDHFIKQWAELMKSVDVKKIKREFSKAKMDLEETRGYAECWITALSAQAPDAALNDLEEMIFYCVKREWGENCSAIMDRNTKKIYINQTDALEIYDLFESRFLD